MTDTPDDEEPLRAAARMMIEAGFTAASHSLRAYVLIGFPGDTIRAADDRLKSTVEMGISPMAMLWRGEKPQGTEWRRFQRTWARPAIIYGKDRGAQ